MPGISIVDLAGHTPGHIGVQIEDGGERLMLVADMLFHPAAHPALPGLGILFEEDKAAAAPHGRGSSSEQQPRGFFWPQPISVPWPGPHRQGRQQPSLDGSGLELHLSHLPA